MNRGRFFAWGIVFEISLGIVGLAGIHFAGVELSQLLRATPSDLLTGAAAVLPPFGALLWLQRSEQPFARELRDCLARHVMPLFRGWRHVQFAWISIAAGIGEELLFRGAIQSGLTGRIGPVVALLLSSIAFGFMHPLSRAYVILTALAGLYLGLLLLVTGSLVPAIIAHAGYDFAALLYLSKKFETGAGSGCASLTERG